VPQYSSVQRLFISNRKDANLISIVLTDTFCCPEPKKSAVVAEKTIDDSEIGNGNMLKRGEMVRSKWLSALAGVSVANAQSDPKEQSTGKMQKHS
jgi:hypothetical protein